MSLATPGGLEPPTFSLEGCCSIRLSYGAKVLAHDARDRCRMTAPPVSLIPRMILSENRAHFFATCASASITRRG